MGTGVARGSPNLAGSDGGWRTGLAKLQPERVERVWKLLILKGSFFPGIAKYRKTDYRRCVRNRRVLLAQAVHEAVAPLAELAIQVMTAPEKRQHWGKTLLQLAEGSLYSGVVAE